MNPQILLENTTSVHCFHLVEFFAFIENVDDIPEIRGVANRYFGQFHTHLLEVSVGNGGILAGRLFQCVTWTEIHEIVREPTFFSTETFNQFREIMTAITSRTNGMETLRSHMATIMSKWQEHDGLAYLKNLYSHLRDAFNKHPVLFAHLKTIFFWFWDMLCLWWHCRKQRAPTPRTTVWAICP
eukprot:GILJ01019447.1.p1 GENE.GILJ01019447.1~~GILJ01019447.1.p1  ORF type:complete len:184 (+),score=12.64 GILJ01019447.1:204-755(+)